MKKRNFTLLMAFLISILVLGACGNSKDENKDETPNEKEDPKTEETSEDVDQEDEEEEEKEEDTASGSSDFSELISYMAETTEGTTNVLYENDEEQVHTMGDISVTLDGYTLVELTDFHTDFEIPFRDQTDGGVIIAKYTVHNGSDEDVSYMPEIGSTVSYDGQQIFHRNNNALLPKEEQLSTKLAHSNDYLLPAGETVTGYAAYSFGKTHLDTILDLSTIAMEVPTPQTDMEDYSTRIGEDGRFNLALTDEGAEKVTSAGQFYEDKVTFDNMGEKEMLKEKSDIGDTQELGDATVTLEGYQFTAFTPNADEAPRFSSFNNGIVLLTTKFKVDNKGSENIDLYGMISKLTVNDGSQYMLSEGMLLRLGIEQVVEPGKQDEFLQVFILDQEQYEKIWKEKSFEIEVGPFKNEDSKDISKGKKVTFTLPN